MNIQERQRQFVIERPLIAARDTPYDTLNSLRGEVDEVEQEINQMHPDLLHKATEALSSELADCLLYLCTLANLYDIDLVGAAQQKISYNQKRFPLSEFQSGNYEQSYKRCKIKAGEWNDIQPGIDYSLMEQ